MLKLKIICVGMTFSLASLPSKNTLAKLHGSDILIVPNTF